MEALNAISEYRLVKAGAASYESLGYGTAGQGPDAIKLMEFLLIDQFIAEANKEANK